MPAAAVPSIVAGGSALLSTGLGIFQSAKANKRANEVLDEINNYERQELTNPYDSLQVSTLSADRQREDMARNLSTTINSVSAGGSRAIASLIPNAINQQSELEAKILADLDNQYATNQQLKAKGNDIVQNLQEQREKDDLVGLGQALNTYRQETTNGINTATKGLISFGSLIGGISPTGSLTGYSSLGYPRTRTGRTYTY